MAPFAKTGGLGDVVGSLSGAVRALGHDVSVFMPRYRSIDIQQWELETAVDYFELIVGNQLEATRVFTKKLANGVKVYFIEHPDYFMREELYGTIVGDYQDNDRRFIYFQRAVLEAAKKLKLAPDIVHCHDWQTGLVPVYLKTLEAGYTPFQKARSVFTIHNLAYQGLFPKEFFGKFDFDPDAVLQKAGFYFYGKISFLRAGIVSSDAVTTVSPQYAKEIQTKEQGCGMEDVLQQRKDLVGILNGIDYSIWDPSCDGMIASRYSDKAPQGKIANKREAQLLSNLPTRAEVPLFAFIGRLSHQKGTDLIVETASRVLENDVQLIVVGQGDAESQRRIARIADQYPNKVAVHLVFDEPLAHQIYAGSDFFLMPSVYEPCGLSQMISLCYGTVPIVFKTGGLVDTVSDAAQGGNGIVFDRYQPDDFIAAVFRAIDLYADAARMDDVIVRAFTSRFPWKDSARRYQEVYQHLLGV